MFNSRGQANIIAIIGMVVATIFVVSQGFNYMNSVGLSSQIQITAQNSIYQSLAQKDYLIQQANYLFDKAQLFDAFLLQPSSYFSGFPNGDSQLSCGYINATTNLPFIPTDKIYYWHNLQGETCLPNNQEILYGLKALLNQSSFSTVNATGMGIKTFLDINFTKTKLAGVFSANFSAPYLSDNYTIYYDRPNYSTAIISVYDKTRNTLVFNGSVGDTFSLGQNQFSILPESDMLFGVLSDSVLRSSFFNYIKIAPSAQFSVITFPSGIMAVIYDNSTSSGIHTYTLTPLLNPNAGSLNAAISEDIAAGLSASEAQEPLVNNSKFQFGGTWYNFTVSNYPNGVFYIFPENYAVVPLQPDFIYYKYLINEFQTQSSENLLFPNYQPLRVSLSLYPLYNPQVCVSYNEIQFNLQNCISAAGYITDTDYISQMMQLGVAFVNESFPVGNANITGFAQYALFNYLENTIHGVNLKTVSVAGVPKYDWYSALILAMGSPQYGTYYLINQLQKVQQQNYYGTTIYNCSQTPADMAFCKNLLSQTALSNIKNLLEYQVPLEVSFLSGIPFNINVLNLSINASEAGNCKYSAYVPADYNASADYVFSVSSQIASGASNFSETLAVPISLNFAYQNGLKLIPTEQCGIQNNPYAYGYPGFTQTLINASGATLLNCAPIIAREFLNNTCTAYIESSSSVSGAKCQSESGGYYCSYTFEQSSMPYSYKRWFTDSNACPDYAEINGANFTYSNPQFNNKLLAMVGGGAISPKENYTNWSFALFNNSNRMAALPVNISIDGGVVLDGSTPEFNLLLSTSDNLGSNFVVAQLNGNQNINLLYNYSNQNGLTVLSSSTESSAIGPAIVNFELNNYWSQSSGYKLTLTTGSGNNVTFSSDSPNTLSIFGRQLGVIGLSTGTSPSKDIVSYLFAHQYAAGYAPIQASYSDQPVENLNPTLISAFGLSTESNTFYNLIALNQNSFSYDYQLQLPLNLEFNYSYLSADYVKVFGVYPSGKIEQLPWWSPSLQSGGNMWIDLGKSATPSAVYILYGSGAYNFSSPDDDIGATVFPIFFYNGSTVNELSYNYSEKPSPNVTLVNGSLELIKDGVAAPFIYNASQTKFYSSFACITIKPSLNIQVFNATYSSQATAFNIGDLYGTAYNQLYPNLNIISKIDSYTSWSAVGT
jgi:hypothetical protein